MLLGLEDYFNGGIKLVPKKIQEYFKTTFQKKDGDNSLIGGMLTCCNANDFEVFVVGEIKHGLFSKMCLSPENEKIVTEVRCKKCGKVISVFDSSCDGYEQCGNEKFAYVTTKPLNCKKCRNGHFSVSIKYEYPDIQELEELEISEIDNAFTWIWINLECNNCGTRYKNFVDCDMT